jgi:hypothetical protein
MSSRRSEVAGESDEARENRRSSRLRYDSRTARVSERKNVRDNRRIYLGV